MQPAFCLRTSYGAAGTCNGVGVPLQAPRHKKEATTDPVLEKKIERDSTMDDVGVFGIVAQAVDWWEADRAGEAAALPVGAH